MLAIYLACHVRLIFSVLCFVVPFVYIFPYCSYIRMTDLNVELSPTQYDLRSELGVFNCKYIESVDTPSVSNKQNDLRIIQLNVRGLINKQDQLKRLINDTQADIVLLCETWLTPSKEKHVNLPTHKIITKNRKDKIGGGVAILLDKSLRTRHRPDLEIKTEILEHTVAELKTDKRNILLISGYRPPNTNVRKFLKEYKELVQHISKLKQHEIVIGIDHNLDLLKSHKHPQTHDFIELNLRKNMFPTISKPTRITTKSATLLDNLFVSLKLQQNLESHIIIEDMSDHMPCMVTLFNQKKCKRESKNITSRPLTDKNIQKINNDLLLDWDNELEGKCVEESFTLFHNKLIETIDKHAPETTRKISGRKLIRDPWITKGIITSLNKQRKLYQNMIREQTTNAKERYTTYRNNLKRLIRAGKRKYLHDKCTEYKQDSRKLWQLINRIIGKENNKSHVIESIKTSEVLRTDPYSITNTFNELFSTIGERYANRHKCTQQETNTLLQHINQNNKSLFMEPCTPKEINNIIRDLPYKTSSGLITSLMYY